MPRPKRGRIVCPDCKQAVNDLDQHRKQRWWVASPAWDSPVPGSPLLLTVLTVTCLVYYTRCMLSRKTKRKVAKKLHVDTRRKSVHVKTSRGFTADPRAVAAAKAMERR